MSVEVQMNKGIMALGMSITAGQLAVNSVNFWVNRVGAFIGGTISNLAVGGSGLKSMAQVGYGNIPYANRQQLLVADGPLNDIRAAGANALPSIEPALDAILGAAFEGYWRGAAWSSPQVVKTGTWTSLGASYGGRSCYSGFGSLAPMYSTDPAASITFQTSGPVTVVHGFLTETNDWQDMAIDVDGVYWGTTEFQGKARPGYGKQPGALVIDGLSSGTHTVKLYPANPGTVVVDGVGVPILTGIAPAILGTIPNIPNWAQYGSIGTWADAQLANDIIRGVVDKWRGYGLDIGCAEILLQPYDFDADGIHTTDRGQLNWSIPYLSEIHITPNAY